MNWAQEQLPTPCTRSSSFRLPRWDQSPSAPACSWAAPRQTGCRPPSRRSKAARAGSLPKAAEPTGRACSPILIATFSPAMASRSRSREFGPSSHRRARLIAAPSASSCVRAMVSGRFPRPTPNCSSGRGARHRQRLTSRSCSPRRTSPACNGLRRAGSNTNCPRMSGDFSDFSSPSRRASSVTSIFLLIVATPSDGGSQREPRIAGRGIPSLPVNVARITDSILGPLARLWSPSPCGMPPRGRCPSDVHLRLSMAVEVRTIGP